MGARAGSPATPASLRVEVLKELQQLIDSKDARDRVDRGPLAETKGREHWLLHLLLRAEELNQAHFDTLIGSAYANLIARLQTIEDRTAQLDSLLTALDGDLRARFESIEGSIGERVEKGLDAATTRLSTGVTQSMISNLDEKWRPVGDSIETFAQGSRQMSKDVADTYRVATQTRLLLNENARRMADLGRDLVALEETLKLVVTKTIEESLRPLEERVAAIEGQVGAVNGTRPAAAKPTSTATAD